jgi:capsular exopolysaccharide synthesis family protein
VTTNNIAVIDRAETPRQPSSPVPLRNMGLAALLGLAAGALAAFAAEALDQGIARPVDVEAKLHIPLLGTIPVLAKGVTPQEAMKDSRSAFWESYFSVRTALQFSSSAGVPRSLLVVSSRPGEGKSTTAVALAHSMARLGARTLLVDADLRKPSLHKLLGLSTSIGFSNYLVGGMGLNEIVQTTDQPNLTVITSGPLPPTPAELLADNRLRTFCATVEQQYDIVVFDGPPIMGFADAPMISAVVAGTIMVIEAAKTGRSQANAALRRLRMARAKILGAVLTKFDVRKASYGYGYGYGYGGAYTNEHNYEYGKPEGQKLKKIAS